MVWSREARGVNRAMLSCFALSLLVAAAAVLIFHAGDAHGSLYLLPNLVGQTAHSVAYGHGLTVVTDTMGTPGQPIAFHAARMPLPSLVVALGERLFGGTGMRATALLKTFLLLCPLWLSMLLVFRVARFSTQPPIVFGTLLLLPFASLPFLADVVNIQVEEGYTYSLLALGLALVLFTPPRSSSDGIAATPLLRTLALGVVLDLLFLSKSAMIVAIAVLLACFLFRIRQRTLQAIVLASVVLCVGGWAVHQHAASGRYTLGTSLDGLNLHKGNNAGFAAHYPPRPGASLDGFDAELNMGNHFADEWEFNDFHRQAALAYMRDHRAETVRNALTKAQVYFLSLTRYGSGESHGLMLVLETCGLVLFRLLLGLTVVASILGILSGGGPGRFASVTFLLVGMACALPFLAGFAYTRHASVLLYPAVLLLCRAMLSEKDMVL